MKDDLISRSALLKELSDYEKELREDREIAIETDDEQMLFAIMNQDTAICRIRRNVLHMPAAYDVDKVVHAKWLGKPLGGYSTVRCSNCRRTFAENSGRWKYCPECGAKMDGGKE